jgi:hypothetical protein
VVVGAGASGIAPPVWRGKNGARVWLNDIARRDVSGLPEDVQTVWGEHPEACFAQPT